MILNVPHSPNFLNPHFIVNKKWLLINNALLFCRWWCQFNKRPSIRFGSVLKNWYEIHSAVCCIRYLPFLYHQFYVSKSVGYLHFGHWLCVKFWYLYRVHISKIAFRMVIIVNCINKKINIANQHLYAWTHQFSGSFILDPIKRQHWDHHFRLIPSHFGTIFTHWRYHLLVLAIISS